MVFRDQYVTLLGRAIRQPGAAMAVGTAILKGHWYRFYYRMRGVRFTAGRGFRVTGSLSIRGPGKVVFGDRVMISGRVTPWTYSPDACITVGSDSTLDAVRFGCKQEITLGSWCTLAECRIMDTNFHSTRVDRRTNEEAPVRTTPVRIGDNVWIGLNAGILPGTTVGENSVIGYGAVCSHDYPANSIIAGNPARVISKILDADNPAYLPPQSDPTQAP